MVRIRNNNRIDLLIWMGTVLLLTLFCTAATNTYGRYALIAVTLAVFLLQAIKTGGTIRFRLAQFHVHWLLFGGYCLLSALWAWNTSRALSQGRTIIEVLLIVSVFYFCYQDEPDLWKLYNAVKWSGITTALYTIYILGIDQVLANVVGGDRILVEFANINTIGIVAAFALVISLYEMLFRKWRLVTTLFCVPTLLVVAASGTRKALLMLMIGAVLLLYYRFKDRNILKTVVRFALAGVVVLAFVSLVAPLFVGLTGRMEGFIALLTGQGEAEDSATIRMSYVELGLRQFAKTPLVGIGMGNSNELVLQEYGEDTYLHNNFVELLCCGGIVGFVIFYAMYACCIPIIFRNRKNEDPLVILGLVMILLMLIMDAARVSLFSKPTIFYFMIFFLHAKKLKKQGEAT